MALESNALCTVADLETELGITPGSETDYLERLIGVVSARIESYCNRSFYNEAAKVEAVPGFGDHLLRISKTPLNSIGSITFDGNTVDSTSYQIHDANAGLIFKATGWNWTVRRYQVGVAADALVGSEEKDYSVTYDGGYVTRPQGGSMTLPFDLEDAAIMWATMRYRGKGRDPSVKSLKLLSYGVSYGNAGETDGNLGIPDVVRGVLDHYRRAVTA